MRYLSSMESRPKRTPQHMFQSEATALAHLKAYSIEPQDKKFVIIAERHYGDKTFDALDHLMYKCGYEVHFI